MHRRPIDPALSSARQSQRRRLLPSDRKGGKITERFSAYFDYPWDKIEEYLRGKDGPAWKTWDFKPTRLNDSWVFEVPEKLTESDRRELRSRRDAPKRTRRPSVSSESDVAENTETS